MDDGITIELISIGMVRDDGVEYYAESAEADLSKANDWVKENVLNHLTGIKTPRAQIAEEIRAFCGSSPDFYAWFGSYDWVCLCQLYGRMLDVPPGWPNLFRELVHVAQDKLSPLPMPNFKKMFANDKPHNALDDARWNRKVWEYCNSILPK